MSCERMRERFSAAYDGALAPEETEELGLHLAGCPACASARADYGRMLDGMTASLQRLVDGAVPGRPYPQMPPRERVSFRTGWLRWAALAGAAVAGAAVGLSLHELDAGPPSEPAAAAVPAASSGEVRCPWHKASREELVRDASYPLVVDECLEHGFELVEASVSRGLRCAGNVRLLYRAGEHRLILEQRPADAEVRCSHEGHVLLGEVAGCFDRPAVGVTSLRWSQRDLAFHLSGNVAPAEAVWVAEAITRQLAD